MSNRAKFAYLKKDDIFERIASGELDQYDICYSKDTNEIFIVNESLEAISIKGRVDSYDSVLDAEQFLNNSPFTYVGQLVAIRNGNHMRAYLVDDNKGTYVVKPIDQCQEIIDYDTLGNIPITNLKGTSDNPIIISDLVAGMYMISGEYLIASFSDTINYAYKGCLFVTDGNGTISRISSSKIVTFKVDRNSIHENETVTEDYLKDHNYTTLEEVKNEIHSTLVDSFVTKKEIENLFE